MTYVEEASDHAFTAFLASLTPGLVQRDRSSGFSKPERKRALYLREKRATEARQAEVQLALQMARQMRGAA
jgi:hypothetical protein